MRKIIEFNNEDEMFKARCALALNIAKGNDLKMYEVLYSLSKHNTNGIIQDAMRVNATVIAEHGLMRKNFDMLINRLSKLGLITRQKKCYILHPLLANGNDMAKDEILLRIKE